MGDPVAQSALCPSTLYVRNLAIKATDDDVRKHFEQCGEVTKVLVSRFGSGRSRGFGFVDFSKPSEAQAALLLSDSLILGREIIVSKSTRAITEKKPKEKEVDETPAKRKIDPDVDEAKKGSKGHGKGDKSSGKSEKGNKGDKGAKKQKLKVDVKQSSDAADEIAEIKQESAASDKPMTNADFRALLL